MGLLPEWGTRYDGIKSNILTKRRGMVAETVERASEGEGQGQRWRGTSKEFARGCKLSASRGGRVGSGISAFI